MGPKILKSGPVPWDDFFFIRPMGPFFSSRPVPRGALQQYDKSDCMWLYVTVCDFMWHYVIVCDCMWLYVALCDSMWLYVTVCDCMWLVFLPSLFGWNCAYSIFFLTLYKSIPICKMEYYYIAFFLNEIQCRYSFFIINCELINLYLFLIDTDLTVSKCLIVGKIVIKEQRYLKSEYYLF